MTKEELKRWFLNKFNSCYCVKHENYPHSIFMIYDEVFIRQKKLCRVTGDSFEQPKEVKEDCCIFEFDYQTGYLHIDYNKIWSVFEKTLCDNYQAIVEILKELSKYLLPVASLSMCLLHVPSTSSFWSYAKPYCKVRI